MNSKHIFLLILSTLFLAGFVSAVTTTLVLDPNGGEQLNRVGTNPYTIDFNITGADRNTVLIDINFSTSASQATGTVIVNDLNSSNATITCVGNDFNLAGKTCTYSWSITHVPNGNYFILVDVNKNGEFSFDASNASFNVSSSYIKTYTGSDLGSIFVDVFGGLLAALARNIQAVVILLLLGLFAVYFKEDIARIFDIFKGLK